MRNGQEKENLEKVTITPDPNEQPEIEEGKRQRPKDEEAVHHHQYPAWDQALIDAVVRLLKSREALGAKARKDVRYIMDIPPENSRPCSHRNKCAGPLQDLG